MRLSDDNATSNVVDIELAVFNLFNK
jgi:hypothetical protein